MVVMGPGSLYTSIVPNLLVPGIAQAIRHTQALRVYVCNLATQPGETDGFTVADHVRAIDRVLGGNYLDVVIANDRLELPPEKRHQADLVRPDWPFERRPTQIIYTDLVDDERPWRHDSRKLAAVLQRAAAGELAGRSAPM